jgi:hypothetical protein
MDSIGIAMGASADMDAVVAAMAIPAMPGV